MLPSFKGKISEYQIKMKLEELLKICTSEKKIISLVGAGGKTTLMYRLATEAAKCGKRVIVSTTTHIICPKNNYAADLESVGKLWSEGKYAVIGNEEAKEGDAPNKLIFPERTFYESVKKKADIILLEADGAKRLPCKVPAAHEPVIIESDMVIGVMGMSAIGQQLRECCFRFLENGKWLHVNEDAKLTEDIAAIILSSDKGTRKAVKNREYIVVLNQCDNEEKTKYARTIANILEKDHSIKTVCCCLK